MENSNDTASGEAEIGRLIASAGPGATARPEAKQRIYDAVHARWQAETGARSQLQARRHTTRRRLQTFAVAASVALTAVTLYWLQGPESQPAPGIELAQFAHIAGNAELLRDGQLRRLASPATAGTIMTGDTLRTGDDGRLALSLGGNLVLRVNVDSELVFNGVDEIDLLVGTIYVDTNGNSNQPLQIATPLGPISHLGTQYEVHFDDAALRIRVREGSVSYSALSSATTIGTAGEQLDFDRRGLVARGSISPNADDWQWAEDLATLPVADEYLVSELLDWISRERGLELEFTTPAVQRRHEIQAISGLEGLNPTESLDVMVRTADLVYAVQGSRLVISN